MIIHIFVKNVLLLFQALNIRKSMKGYGENILELKRQGAKQERLLSNNVFTENCHFILVSLD